MGNEHLRNLTAAGIVLPRRPRHGLLDTLFLWSERARQRRMLSGLGDRLLKDVGLSRGDAVHEADKPFWRA